MLGRKVFLTVLSGDDACLFRKKTLFEFFKNIRYTHSGYVHEVIGICAIIPQIIHHNLIRREVVCEYGFSVANLLYRKMKCRFADCILMKSVGEVPYRTYCEYNARAPLSLRISTIRLRAETASTTSILRLLNIAAGNL